MAKKSANIRTPANSKKEKGVSRVRWSPEEQALLVETAAMAMKNKEVFSLRDALAKAQESLPKDRQRDIAALSQVPWFIDNVPKKVKELEEVQVSSLESQIAEAVEAANLRARLEIEGELISKAGALLSKILVAALQDPTLRLLLLPGQPVAHIPNHNPMPRGASREKKPRVVVAGALNDQARHLETLMGQKLDLRFWSKDQSSDTLKSMLKNADAAVGMVGFLSHSHDGILKSSKIPYHPVSGGVSQVKRTLEELL
jgi:uncharacterized protein (DUF1778 family)